jgi:hypothetical protein
MGRQREATSIADDPRGRGGGARLRPTGVRLSAIVRSPVRSGAQNRVTNTVQGGDATAADSTARARCNGTTQRATACQAFALPGGEFCAVHEPERAEQVRAARSKGGKVAALASRRRHLDTPGRLVRFASSVIQDALDGTLDLAVAKTVLYGVGIQRSLVEASDIEQRLAALEQRLAGSRR